MTAPIITLHPSQTRVELTEYDVGRAIQAAHWITASPHEWKWSQTEQEAMARYVLWAHQRLSAIEQMVTTLGWQERD